MLSRYLLTLLLSNAVLAMPTLAASTSTPSDLPSLVDSLNLTIEQKSQIETHFKEWEKRLPQVSIDGIRAAKKQQLTLIAASGFDKSAADKLVSEVQMKEKAIVLADWELKHDIYQTLTLEQKEQFKAGIKAMIEQSMME